MNRARLVVVGGGPAGMMAGLLFARAGVPTLVLEKHRDFLRDFRGDTVHPSTLDLFGELGLLDALLREPHDRVETVGAVIGGRPWPVADFRHLPAPCRFIAMMPQWHFLDFVARTARRLPTFALRMRAEAVDLVERDGRVAGVRLASGEAIDAALVILAAGRQSALRAAAALPSRDLGAPIDVFWFRVPKPHTAQNDTQGYVAAGEMVMTIDRGDYYQCARVIAKGSAAAVQARGIDAFRDAVAAAAPPLRAGIAAIEDWSAVKLLGVSLDRLERWHRPGLLAIGDAAHAMSPVGGVGINLAVQDAVAAANVLAATLARGQPVDALLPRVAARRLPAVRIVQGLQHAIHGRAIGAALAGRVDRAPLALRLLARSAWLRRIPARVLGLGVRREHVRSPAAFPLDPGA